MEQWTPWKPLPNLAPLYHWESLSDQNSRFTLTFIKDSRYKGCSKVRVIFPSSIELFSIIDESFALKTADFLSKNYSDSFFGKWAFFTRTNSEQLKEISKYCQRKLTHFCVLTSNFVIDVISDCEPIVECLTED